MPALLPILAIAAVLAGVGVVVVASSSAPRRLPKLKGLKAASVDAPLLKAKPTAAIKNAFAKAKPVYIKSDGRTMFYVGACLDQWTEDMETRCQRDTGGDCGAKAIATIEKVLAWYGAGVTQIADWLKKRLCLRLRAKLRRYQYDGQHWWAVDWRYQGDLEIQMWDGTHGDVVTELVKRLQESRPMTLAKRSGYKRAWILPDWPTGTRNKEAMMVVWAVDEEPGRAVMQELVPEVELRRMILLLADSGAFTRSDLERIDSKRSWYVSTLAQVKDEYPGIS